MVTKGVKRGQVGQQVCFKSASSMLARQMSNSTIGCPSNLSVERPALFLPEDFSALLLLPAPIISILLSDLLLPDALSDNLSSLTCSDHAWARHLSNSRLAGADRERCFGAVGSGKLDPSLPLVYNVAALFPGN